MVKAVIFPKDLLGFQTAKINFRWNIKYIIDNNFPALLTLFTLTAVLVKKVSIQQTPYILSSPLI